MKIGRFTLAALLVASTASAAPMFPAVSSDVGWQQVVAPGNNALMPFSNASYDCKACNLGYLLAPLTGFEYLWGPSRLSHEWDAVTFELAMHHTGDQAATFARASDGAFRLTTSEGYTYDCGGWGWEHCVTLRRWVSETPAGRWAQFFFAEEDLFDGDWDFNDITLMALVFVPFDVPSVCVVNCGRPPDVPPGVPEPSSLILFGLAALACSRWLRRRA